MRQRELKTEKSNRRLAGQLARSNRLSRLAIGVIAGCFVLTAASSAKTDSLPTWANTPWLYWSTEMKEVTVKFSGWACKQRKKHCKWGRTYRGVMIEKNKAYQVAKLPRAYIWAAGQHSKMNKNDFFFSEELPDPLIVKRVHIEATLPDMAPLTVTWKNWATRKENLEAVDVQIEKKPYTKHEDVRKLTMKAAVRTTAHNVDARKAMQRITSRRRQANAIGEYLGYDSFNSGGSAYYYINENAQDEITLIECWDKPGQARPNRYCKHYFPLNSKLIVELSFIDFRTNGGLEFMRQRIRAFKAKFCPIFKCDARAVEPNKEREQGQKE